MTKSYGNHGKKVHRPYSSCISSVEKLIETLSSSPCQLRLGVDLSRHSLRPYILLLLTSFLQLPLLLHCLLLLTTLLFLVGLLLL